MVDLPIMGQSRVSVGVVDGGCCVERRGSSCRCLMSIQRNVMLKREEREEVRRRR